MWIDADELGDRDEVPIATPDGPNLKRLYIILGEAPDGRLYFWCDPTGNSIMGWAEREEACRNCDELNSLTMHAAVYARGDIEAVGDTGAAELQTLH